MMNIQETTAFLVSGGLFCLLWSIILWLFYRFYFNRESKFSRFFVRPLYIILFVVSVFSGVLGFSLSVYSGTLDIVCEERVLGVKDHG